MLWLLDYAAQQASWIAAWQRDREHGAGPWAASDARGALTGGQTRSPLPSRWMLVGTAMRGTVKNVSAWAGTVRAQVVTSLALPTGTPPQHRERGRRAVGARPEKRAEFGPNRARPLGPRPLSFTATIGLRSSQSRNRVFAGPAHGPSALSCPRPGSPRTALRARSRFRTRRRRGSR
jgi:hypothetical protein